MIATVSAAIATGPVGRSYVTLRGMLRDGPVGRFAALAFFDWLIPCAIVTAIVVGSGFVLLGAA
jgi:hypothetical protein